jgi:hypothetical protein
VSAEDQDQRGGKVKRSVGTLIRYGLISFFLVGLIWFFFVMVALGYGRWAYHNIWPKIRSDWLK